MTDIDILIDGLRKTPIILENLLKDIPKEILKVQRIPGKWSIHEHVCHFSQAEAMILNRFKIFKEKEDIEFEHYLPGTTTPVDELMRLNMEEEIARFQQLRTSLIEVVSGFDTRIWKKQAKHPEYKLYTAYILLRHLQMHDHFHMYRIEQLWLTEDGFL